MFSLHLTLARIPSLDEAVEVLFNCGSTLVYPEHKAPILGYCPFPSEARVLFYPCFLDKALLPNSAVASFVSSLFFGWGNIFPS